LAVDGDPARVKWVLYAADAEYMLGDFDGREFRPDGGKHRLWSGDFYASQTYTDAPDGRRIQIGWGRGVAFPGMPFNQQMSIACELSLVSTGDGVRLRAEPVRELAALRNDTRTYPDASGECTVAEDLGELLDVTATLSVPANDCGGILVRGIPVVWDREGDVLRVADLDVPIAVASEDLPLRVLVDRGSIEVFAADGLATVSKAVQPATDDCSLRVIGEQPRLANITTHRLGSIWQ
jgi:fructan beta-fructosidase